MGFHCSNQIRGIVLFPVTEWHWCLIHGSFLWFQDSAGKAPWLREAIKVCFFNPRVCVWGLQNWAQWTVNCRLSLVLTGAGHRSAMNHSGQDSSCGWQPHSSSMPFHNCHLGSCLLTHMHPFCSFHPSSPLLHPFRIWHTLRPNSWCSGYLWTICTWRCGACAHIEGQS